MSKRYFINNHDSIIGQEILKELNKEGTDDPAHMVTYMTDFTKRERPKGVKKVLNRHTKPKLMRKKMLEDCDYYIYDLHFGDLEDILFGANILHKATLEEQKVLILISDVMVWNETPKKVKEKVAPVAEEGEEGENAEENVGEKEEVDKDEDEEEGSVQGSQDGEGSQGDNEQNSQKQEDEIQQEEQEEEPVEYTFFNEKDYKKRKCSEKYIKMKRMEDLLLSLNKENLKVIVVCSGILYGLGELAFRNHLKTAWLQNPQALPYLGSGQNLIPTIHINDLAKFIIKVAENPPENNYLFAIDNTKDRRQKIIIQSIADGVGSRKIESVESTELIDENTQDIFNLDVDMAPSPLLVGDEENPVEFEWKCEGGLTDPKNMTKVLEEFQKEHIDIHHIILQLDLRPIKIIMFTPENERSQHDSMFDWSAKEISEHYRIPRIKVREVIEDIKENMLQATLLNIIVNFFSYVIIQEKDGILGDDVREEYDKIIQYLDEKQPRKLDETLKVLYRVMKWRLNQNDCLNRGFILDNYPQFGSECDHIFFPQYFQKQNDYQQLEKKKLDRIRPKPKKVKKTKKRKQEEDQEENQQSPKEEEAKKQQEDEDEEDNEDKEEGEDEENEEAEEKNNKEEGSPKNEEEQEEEEEEEEEEQPPEEEEQPEEEEEEDPENPKPKIEPYYPESIISIKKMTQDRRVKLNNSSCQIIDYFSQKDIEAYILDTFGKDQFEIFESQRIYIERGGRPFNYLLPENELESKHKSFYQKVNDNQEQKKKVKKEEDERKIQQIKLDREQVCKDQIDYIHKNELEIDKVKNIPFRNYLMEYIIPELNEGLLEVSNMLPDDPVEFLAEYIYSQSYE